MLKKRRRYCQFLEQVGGSYVSITRTKLKPGQSIVRYGDGSYTLETEKPSYQTPVAAYYHVDIKTGQVWLNSVKFAASPKLTDAVFSRALAKQLSGAMTRKNFAEKDWFLLLVCIGFGVGLGFIINLFAKVSL